MNIEDLNINEKDKLALAELINPKTIAEIAAFLDVAYTTAFTKLVVWEAKGWIKKVSAKRLKKFYLNQEILQTKIVDQV